MYYTVSEIKIKIEEIECYLLHTYITKSYDFCSCCVLAFFSSKEMLLDNCELYIFTVQKCSTVDNDQCACNRRFVQLTYYNPKIMLTSAEKKTR